jgi:hypothetical protein
MDMAPAPAGADARQFTRTILNRDRRRIRLLASMTTLFWVLATASVICLCPFYVIIIAPRLRAYEAGRANLQNDWNEWARAGEYVAYWILPCILFLLLAAIFTILLILLSRRATLRQINVSLAEISEQLKLLRQAPPGEPREPTGTA